MSFADTLRFLAHQMMGVRLHGMRRINLGRRARLGCGTVLDARGGFVEIGDDVTACDGTTVLTGEPPGVIAAPDDGRTRGSVFIGAGAWLGPRCVILPGTHIGARAIVAAGALVNDDVTPGAIVAGTPARLIGHHDTGGCLEFAARHCGAAPTPLDESPPTASPLA